MSLLNVANVACLPSIADFDRPYLIIVVIKVAFISNPVAWSLKIGTSLLANEVVASFSVIFWFARI